MSSINLYDISIAPMTHMLKGMSAWLHKAEEHAKANSKSPDSYLEARLAPDMKPLPFQIQSCSNNAKFIGVRVAGYENVVMEDDETTMDQLQARIAKTLEIIATVKREDFDGKEGVNVELFGGKYKFTAKDYIINFAMPNFYFHAVTTYDILRNLGVDIGKMDFLNVKPAA